MLNNNSGLLQNMYLKTMDALYKYFKKSVDFKSHLAYKKFRISNLDPVKFQVRPT